MDPFKKSLGINFGPLFSAPTQESGSKNREKKGAQLFGDPPSGHPNRDRFGNKIKEFDDFVPIPSVPEDDWFQDSLHGIILVDGKRYRLVDGIWYIWEEPTPLREGRWGRSTIRSSQGVHYFTNGRAMTDREVAERNRELGIGYGYGGGGGATSNDSTPNRSPVGPPKFVDPAERENQEFNPGKWYSIYKSSEEEKRMIRTVIEDILNLQCLEEFVPGLLECLREAWKNTSFAMSNYECLTNPYNQGNAIPKWSNLAEENQPYHELSLCRDRLSINGKLSYKKVYSALLHEMLHLCISSNQMQEFDPYVLSNLCDSNAFGKDTKNTIWTNMCIGNPPWYRANSKGPTENFLTMIDPETGKILYASNLFIWDPVTGEIFRRESLPFGESYNFVNNPHRLKKGKKLPIIWKCSG